MPETENVRRSGDRRDGRLLRTLSPFGRVSPYFILRRGDALDYYSDSVEISGLEPWFRAKRRDNWEGMGMLHLFIAAYVRTVACCPGINRFVSGQKLYARNGIEVLMTMKLRLNGQGEESILKIAFDPTDTIYDVYRRLGDTVDELRTGGTNETDRLAESYARFRGLPLKFIVWCLRLLDYFGRLPQRVLNASPFHGSMAITDLSSQGIGPMYHHLNSLGNLPLYVSMGARRRQIELDEGGAPVERKYIDYRVTMDGRILPPSYAASALKFLKYFLCNPAELERPPERVLEDVM